MTKRVSFNEILTPNGTTARNGGGNLGSTVKLRRNHISAIVEDKQPIDETSFGGSTASTPRMPNTPLSSSNSTEDDIFESEFLRVLAKVHAALER